MIYLVEDDSNIREFVLYALSGQGMEARGFERPSRFFAALEQQLIRGLLMLLLGLFCIFNARWFIATFPVLTMLYGVGLLVVGVAKVQWTVDILRVKVGRWYLPGISALVSLVCAAIILFNPFASTVALWVFIGVALIVEAAVDLLAILWDRLRGA